MHGAHRIGHGVRLQRDVTFHPDGSATLGPLARYVLDHGVHLEMAPTCHVQIGAIADLPSHPIGPMLRNGFDVGVNTDNRLMSNVTPSSELLAVAQTFDLTWTEIERLVTNAMDASFAPYERRRHILATQITPWFATHRT